MAFGALVGAVKELTGTGGGGTKTYPITSGCFARIEYDTDKKVLNMTFQKGGSYQIEGIEEIEVERWVNAASVGKYFNENVRGKY